MNKKDNIIKTRNLFQFLLRVGGKIMLLSSNLDGKMVTSRKKMVTQRKKTCNFYNMEMGRGAQCPKIMMIAAFFKYFIKFENR